MPASPLCAINPDHVGLVRSLGAVFMFALITSLITGKAYFRRVIDREEEPAAYWQTVLCYAFVATFCLGGSFICPVLPAG